MIAWLRSMVILPVWLVLMMLVLGTYFWAECLFR